MPQLDMLTWVNQSFMFLFGFWFLYLIYSGFILKIVGLNSKLFLKVTLFRDIVNTVFIKYRTLLVEEVQLLYLFLLVVLFNTIKNVVRASVINIGVFSMDKTISTDMVVNTYKNLQF